MKRFLIFFTLLVLTTNTALARCHGHYHGSYHYYSTPVYLVRSDYYENEEKFSNCDSHYLLTKTNINIYSNGARRVYNYHTVFNNDGSILLADCTDIQHIIHKKQHYFLFQKNGLYYIANSKGEVFAKRKYSRMYEIFDNRILVKVNKKYGIIDLDENIIVPIKYKSYKTLGNNLYLTKLNGYYGIISSKGEILYRNEYDSIKPMLDTFVLKKYGKYGLVDINGKLILECDYDKIKKLDEYILVKKDGLYQVYSSSGNLVSKDKYKKVRIERNVLEGKLPKGDFQSIIEF